ncbi:fasciclin domain-containing protein [Chitinophaga polysaccharea]|uniref:fasciclin domain-containing protein n=1 Tax=Chitinophaga polysaccharea TaxID=1293035 RepID=UPI00163D390B|nr:fasciclin domain-containing protein [Chitinophaga polysaccharea]
MKLNKLYILPLLLLISACVKEPVDVPQENGDDRPLLTILKNNYNFSMFYNAVQRTGLDKTLEGKGPFTVLVPDNTAFTTSGITADSLAAMDTASLAKLLRYHIIPEQIRYAAVPQAIDFPYETLAGLPVYTGVPIPGPRQFQNLTINILHINGVSVSKTDILAGNGVIHALSRVLRLPAASVQDALDKDPQYSYFVHALKEFGLWDQLGKPGVFTVMAPANQLFDQYGVTEAGLDPAHYRKMMVTPYIVNGHRFFSTDLLDAPLDNAQPGILTPEFLQTINCYNQTFGVWPLYYKQITDLVGPPYWGDPYIYGPAASLVNSDHLTGNGIVHGLSDLPMRPDSARINP